LVDSLEPTPVDDFERRMQVCRAMGITHLKDGKLEVIFRAVPRAVPSLEDLAMRHRQMMDSGEEG